MSNIIDVEEYFVSMQILNGRIPHPAVDVLTTPGLDYNNLIFGPHLPDHLAEKMIEDLCSSLDDPI